MAKSLMNLFQFWDTSSPPEEVSVLMQSWENDPDFAYRRFDEPAAESFIAQALDNRAVAAYRTCAIPAMKADFFRYCALWAEGGVWVDADTRNSGKLPAFIEGCDLGMLMNRQCRIANDFMFVRAPRAPLFERVIEQAIENVENRISNNVWKVTGPGIMSHMHADAVEKARFDGFDIRPVEDVRKIVLFQHKLAYKETSSDWRNHLSDGAVSIFQDV